MSDSNHHLSSWLQVISNVAIVIGFGLVIYELNQSKQLAWAQFSLDDSLRRTSIQIAKMGEDPREALATAALHPADLNERDVVALDAYYSAIAQGWTAYRIRSRIAGIDVPWRAIVADSVRQNFCSEPSRRWLRAWIAGVDDTFGMRDVADVAQRAIQDDSSDLCRRRYELLLEND
jgi:hypothetical protein